MCGDTARDGRDWSDRRSSQHRHSTLSARAVCSVVISAFPSEPIDLLRDIGDRGAFQKPLADIYQIAKNCRTSVEMIEKHYVIYLKNTLDASLINVRRDRTTKRGSKSAKLSDAEKSLLAESED